MPSTTYLVAAVGIAILIAALVIRRIANAARLKAAHKLIAGLRKLNITARPNWKSAAHVELLVSGTWEFDTVEATFFNEPVLVRRGGKLIRLSADPEPALRALLRKAVEVGSPGSSIMFRPTRGM